MKRKKKEAEEGPLHYRVSIPIAGSVSVIVEAMTEKDAIEKAWEHIGDDDADVEWEAHEHIAQGNVLYASMNEIEVDIAD